MKISLRDADAAINGYWSTWRRINVHEDGCSPAMRWRFKRTAQARARFRRMGVDL